ncbi:hypothetical protein A4H97_29540 [Niastella yeongjuensis]|uniref:WG repeat-containing protein n=1 Tax=Niastella yeongjuensis TaxID=354355 RepID=A0A1V9ET42_9BACT|nr:WG repeat-containing protein [Niastella yeongjuensis]OQP49025.1 hypothetical protein A4H97_29540 [Niastella yeongjuensis]SEP10754.1 WG containing repeat-containing protein [Niastella yeongjuensis]
MKKCLSAFLFLLLQQFAQQTTFAQNKSGPATPLEAPQYEKWYPVFLDLYASSPAFIDSKGRVKLAFDSIYTLLDKGQAKKNVFEGEYMVLVKSAKSGNDEYFITDRKGNLKPFPPDIRVVYTSGNRVIVQQQKLRKMAIWKTDFTPLTPFKYDFIRPYSEGLATAELDNYYTLIDEQGIETIPMDHALSSKDSTGDKQTTYSNTVSEGLVAYAGEGKFGIMDKNGKNKTAPIFDFLEPFHNGMAYAIKKDTCGYVNKDGKFVLPFNKAHTYITNFSCGLARARSDDKAFVYYINTKGKMAFPGRYLSGGDFSNGYAVISNDKTLEKKQIIDTHGKVVYEGFFEDAWFGPDMIVITTETSFAGYTVQTNNYKYLDYNFHTIWQPAADKRIITNLKALPESEFPGIKHALLGVMNWHYTLKDVEPFLNKAALVQLRLSVTDRSFVFPPAILKMTDLEDLDLSYSGLSDIPEDIGKLVHLKNLKLDYTNVQHLPESLNLLKDLQSISVVSTKLSMEEIMAFKQHLPGVKIIIKESL